MSTLGSDSRSQALFQRHPGVSLRQEGWGGYAFQRDIGELLELDEQGFQVLAALAQPLSIRGLRAAVDDNDRPLRIPELSWFVAQLEQREFVRRGANTTESGSPRNNVKTVGYETLDKSQTSRMWGIGAPLVAHWAVTYRCNLACRFCYSRSGPHREREPDPEVRQRIVRRLAEWGLFEVALGGGEPTLLPDFPELLATIRQYGLVPNVTTNGVLCSHEVVQALLDHAGTVHLSADQPELLDMARGTGVSGQLQQTARRLSAHGISWGVNLLLTPETARSLDRSLVAMEDLGAAAVTLLRPKGSWANRFWPGFPTADDVSHMSKCLAKFTLRKPAVRLYVDTALRVEWSQAELMEDPEPEIWGCGGGQRHVAVTPDGDIYPCSHTRWKALRMGNVLQDDFHQLWLAGPGHTARQRYVDLCCGKACACRQSPKPE